MSKSIISNERVCYICGSHYGLEKHHCIHGYANRKNAEKAGLWVYLCRIHHTGSRESAHMNAEIDLKLKQIAQTAYEKEHSREEFMKIFGRSWL